MNEHIFLSFSLHPLKEANRTFENAILPVLKKLAERFGKSTLHHGFLSREQVVSKGFSTTVIDALEELFPNTVQYSPIDGDYTKMRETMAYQASKHHNALVLVIGPIVAGVEEEAEAYRKAGMGIHYHNWQYPEVENLSVQKKGLDDVEIASVMYGAYCNGVGGKAYNGDPLPSWEEFYLDPEKQKQVTGWIIAAQAVINHLS